MELDPRLGGSQGGNPYPTSSTSTASPHLNGNGTGGDATADAPSSHYYQNQHQYPDPQETQQHHQPRYVADNGDDAKKPRACEACRGLKVRCEPDPNDDNAPCKRCSKAGRRCVTTVPSRKRQKKTDSRVSELEKKIDALTASLQARAAGTASVPAASNSPDDAARGAQPRASVDEGGHRSWMRYNYERSGATSAPPPTKSETSSYQSPTSMAGQKRKASERKSTMDDDKRDSSSATASSPWTREGDVIDRGIITVEKSAELFVRYKDYMAPHMPAVIFPPSMTAAELRRTKPTLFLAVMVAGVSEDCDLQRMLQKELMQTFGEKVFVVGEKNMEIVQALVIGALWYWPPDHFEELKFYQLVHSAGVMAIDIGLGKKSIPKRNAHFGWQQHPLRRNPPPDPVSVESRRTWLACYFLASNTAMALRRPHLIRWTPFMAESLDILKSSPDRAPSDTYFCHLIWSHRLGEEIGEQFSMDDPNISININEARTQHALKTLERDLEKYRSNIDEDLMQPTLKISLNMVSLYMHEIALHTKQGFEAFRPPFCPDTLKEDTVATEALSTAHINALSASLIAIDGIINAFLGMEVHTMRSMPVMNFVRVSYAMVVLLKMYFSASAPRSDLASVIEKDNLRVDHYLDALLEKFCLAAADGKSRPASKFLVVLAMLRSWFMKQKQPEKDKKDGDNDDEECPFAGQTSPPTQQQIHQHQQRTAAASTPLHLLSEVATGGGDHNQRTSTSMAPPQTRPQQIGGFYTPEQQRQQQTPLSSTSSDAWLQNSSASSTSFPIDPAMTADPTVSLPPANPNNPGFFDLNTLMLGYIQDPADASLDGPWLSEIFPNGGEFFQGMPDMNFFPQQ